MFAISQTFLLFETHNYYSLKLYDQLRLCKKKFDVEQWTPKIQAPSGSATPQCWYV